MELNCKKCGTSWTARKERPKTCPNEKCRTTSWATHTKYSHIEKDTKMQLLTSTKLGRLIIVMFAIQTTTQEYAKITNRTEPAITQAMNMLKHNDISRVKEKIGKNIVYEINEKNLKKICVEQVQKIIDNNYNNEVQEIMDCKNYENLENKGFVIPTGLLSNSITNAIQLKTKQKDKEQKKVKKKIESYLFAKYIQEYYKSHFNHLSIPLLDLIKKYVRGVEYL